MKIYQMSIKNNPNLAPGHSIQIFETFRHFSLTIDKNQTFSSILFS